MRAQSPVPIPDLVSLYNELRLTRSRACAAIVQAARSESIGWYGNRHDRLLAAFLLYPLPEMDGLDRREALFVICPGAGAKTLTAMARYARLTLRGFPDDVRLTGRAETDAGARIFRLAGFSDAGGGRFEWRADGGLCGRDQDAVPRRGHERPGRRDCPLARQGAAGA